MLFDPIKLLKSPRLLKFVDEASEIDTGDYIESRIKTDENAKNLMAIEDASEIAKRFIFKSGTFEKILSDINPSIHCKLTKKSTHVHLGSPVSNGGHYVAMCVDHEGQKVSVSDSMGSQSPCKPTIKKNIKSVLPNYTVSWKNSKSLQPTGGFVDKTVEKFMDSCGIRKRTPLVDEAFIVSQYDELSQHHFCYTESIISFAHGMLGTPEGPVDPKQRLVFIKRLTWGLIHKYCTVSRTSVEWKYFENNFRFYMRVKNKLSLVKKLYYMPTAPINKFMYEPIQIIRLPTRDFSQMSLVQIIQWALT